MVTPRIGHLSTSTASRSLQQQLGSGTELHLPPRLYAQLPPVDTHGRFLRRLVGIEIQTENTDLVESVAPEQTHVHGRRLGPDGPVRAPSAVHGEPQQLPSDAQASVVRVRDNGVDDEPVSEHVLALALEGSVFQLGGETVAVVARVAA